MTITTTQREAALRLADDMDTPISVWADQVAHLLRELAAEPQGEPVAWQLPGTDSLLTAAAKTHHGARAAAYTVPLYTHPPQQRKPLTDEQINRLDTEAIHGGPDSQYAFRFARAIERAITGEPT